MPGQSAPRIHAHNASFPRDLETRRLTSHIRNPIIGERVEVPVSLLLNDPGTVGGPSRFRNLAADGSVQDVYRQFRIENELIKLDSVRGAPPDWPATHIENSCQWVELDLFANETITPLPVHFCGHYAYEYPKWLKVPARHGHRNRQGHGYTPDEFSTAWAWARRRAIAAGDLAETYRFNEIRAKSASDKAKAVVASQRLGHATQVTTEEY